MLKHFEAVNVQEPKDSGAPPAGALSVLGPGIQPRAWVPTSAGPKLPAPSPRPPCCLGGSLSHALTLEANDLLIFPTSQVKVLLYTAFARASLA